MSIKVSKHAGAIGLAALLTMAVACEVDELYSLENIQEADLSMTVFQDGITVPLGSTAKLRADSILKKTGLLTEELSEYLIKDENGAYLIKYSGSYSLDDQIKDAGLSDFSIDGVSIDQSFNYEIGEIRTEDFRFDGQSFGQDFTIDDFADQINNIKIDPFEKSVSASAGLNEGNYDFDFTVTPFNQTQTLITKSDLETVASFYAGEFSVPAMYTPTISITDYSQTITAITMPEQILSVDEIAMRSGSRISVSVSVDNCLLTDGVVTPNITIDLGDFISIVGKGSTFNLSTLTLSPSNGYSASQDFFIEGIDPDKLFVDKDITVNGTVSIAGAKTSTSYISTIAGDMKIVINIAFDLGIDHVTCEIKPVEFTKDESIDFTIDPVTLPEQVEKVAAIYFDDASIVTLNINTENLADITGLDAKIVNLTATFPSSLHISGDGVVGNQLIITNASLASPVIRNILVESVDLPDPVDNKISLSESITVTATAEVSGSVNSSTLPRTAEKDIKFNVSLNGVVNVRDFDIMINGISEDINIADDIHFDITDAIADFGVFTVTPAGSPSLVIDLDIPDTGSLAVSAGDGIVITMPEFVMLGSVPAALNYNEAAHTFTITSLTSAHYEIPILGLEVAPVHTETGYSINSSYSVVGTISINKSKIDKATLLKLSGARFEVTAEIPDLEAESISMDKLSFNIDQSESFDIIKAKDLPEQIVAIKSIDLKGNKVAIDVAIENLPDIGTGKYMVDLNVNLPEFISPNVIPIKKEIVDGALNVEVNLEGLDLSAYDLAAMREADEKISGEVTIKGSIYAEDPSVDISSIASTIGGTLTASIGDTEGKISIESVTGVVDFSMGTSMGFNMQQVFSALSNITLELPEIDATIDIESNLGIPVNAKASVASMYGKVASADSTEFNLVFPFSEDGSNVIAKNDFKIDINKYLNAAEKPDSLRLSVAAAVDKTKDTKIVLGDEYHLSFDYAIELPIRLGESTRFEMSDTLALGNVGEYLTYTAFGLAGEVDNTMPLGVELKIELLCEDGGVYTSFPLKQECRLAIAAGSKSEIETMVTPAGTSDKAPTHLKLTFVATANGEDLHEDSYLQARLSAVLPEGLSFDPSNFNTK